VAGALGVALPNVHQPVGLAKWQGLQKNRVDDAEYSGIGAYAKRQDAYDHSRKARPPDERSPCNTDVL